MSEPTQTASPPTVVLLHGAFADASSWSGVIKRLQTVGVTVTAPANPLRGTSADSAYIAGLLEQIPGPVVAVGHSYGGAVITNAATKANNVVGLVYVAGFATEEGERLADATGASQDAILTTGLVEFHYPTTDGELAVEFAVNPERFQEILAADLPAEDAAVMAAIQRPVAALAFSDPGGPPAWRSLPSWAVIATGDKAAGTDVTRSMAQRAGATITEVDSSHVVMVSQPQAVTDVILEAVAAVGAAPKR
jgi:pimeloyl-ACP methyl ester carboxylesterase